MPIAFTRAVSPRLAECETTQAGCVDVPRAVAQHEAYEAALRAAGLEVRRLPPLDDYPDGMFVEDNALLLDEHAVILRPGAASRAGETASTADALGGQFTLHRLGAGHVDGGDVLRIGQTLYVGISGRTDLAGIRALGLRVAPLGFDVVPATQSRSGWGPIVSVATRPVGAAPTRKPPSKARGQVSAHFSRSTT